LPRGLFKRSIKAKGWEIEEKKIGVEARNGW
jgi:hypothetical protein